MNTTYLPAYLLEPLSPYFPQVDVFHTFHFTSPAPVFLAFSSKVITTIQPAGAKTATIYRRIGSTTYKVRVHFSETAKETMNDKILHLIRRRAVTNGYDCGTMGIPQTSQPLEGSST